MLRCQWPQSPSVGLYIFFILIYKRAAQGGIRRDEFLGSVSAVERATILFNDRASSGHGKNYCFLTHAWVFLSRRKISEGRDVSAGRCTAAQTIQRGSGKREGAGLAPVQGPVSANADGTLLCSVSKS